MRNALNILTGHWKGTGARDYAAFLQNTSETTGPDRTGSGSQADVLPCHFIVHERSEFVASGLFRTFGAGFEGSGGAALAHFTQTGTEICLDSFHPAAQTVDVFRLDFVSVVPLTPKLRSLFAKGVIVIDSGDAGITLFAIKAAIADKVFFHNSKILVNKQLRIQFVK